MIIPDVTMLVGITWEKGKEKIINQVVTSGILIRDLSGYDSLILACAARIIALLPTQFRALIRVETLVTWVCLYLVPRPHYYARPMRFGSRGPRKFLRPRQTRRTETFWALSIYEKKPEISVVAKVEFPIGKKLFHLVVNPGTWRGARPWTWNWYKRRET